jgi:bifunctional DNase/RNase
MEPAENLVEVAIWRMAMDEKARIPVVILREKEGTGKLPIWIGTSEANAIVMKLQGKEFTRPMTHDLLVSILEVAGLHVRRIEIASLKDSTYFARIILQREHELYSVDARPSDSIALAIRADRPIFVARELLSNEIDEMLPDVPEEPGMEPAPTPEERADRLRRRIESMRLEDFGRYTF